ncbi:hypothetical protein E4U43_006834, partial [Claviceps pusilla]
MVLRHKTCGSEEDLQTFVVRLCLDKEFLERQVGMMEMSAWDWSIGGWEPIKMKRDAGHAGP